MKKAEFFRVAENGLLECELCPHRCRLAQGQSGICGARKNEGGEPVTLNYGVVTGLSMDPIEKKPLYHYYPGSRILSVGTVGCNMKCPFCQNYPLSRYFNENAKLLAASYRPEDMHQELRNSLSRFPDTGFGGIAYTYSEPVVWFEFVRDTSVLLAENGFQNVLVTNGFINPEPLKKLLPSVQAVNIDLKAFSEENYRKLGGKLKTVLETISAFRSHGVHTELTTLVVTGLNDGVFELEKLVKWIAALDPLIPLHLSRYFPQYRYDKPATDTVFLKRVSDMARTHLKYVYLGNVSGPGCDTVCPKCGQVLVQRSGYTVRLSGLENGACASCGRKADLVLSDSRAGKP